jgi:hypothetical protein
MQAFSMITPRTVKMLIPIFFLIEFYSPNIMYPNGILTTPDGIFTTPAQEEKPVPKAQELHKPHHVIVTPYRDRPDNLAKFIEHMGLYLSRNFVNDTFSIYVMEQADRELFSRSFLLNAGLAEIIRARPDTHCVIMHDVDLLPIVDGVPYNNCTYPTQLGSELEHFDWKVPYLQSCGGVVSLHVNDWKKINGMSNDYEGWGGEDDDLFARLKWRNLLYGPGRQSIVRPPKGKGVFANIEVRSKPNKGSHAKYGNNLALLKAMEQNSFRSQSDGLNDVEYLRLDDQLLRSNGTEGFDEAHIVKIVGQENCSQPTNSTAHCVKGISSE